MSSAKNHTFNWGNFADLERIILGPDASKNWEIESDFGKISQIESDDEYCVGTIEFLDLKRGLKIVIVDSVWFNDHEFRIQDGDWIRFNFSLSIDIEMTLSEDKSVKVVTPSWRIINNPGNMEVIERIPKNKRSAWVTICCKKDMIEAISGDDYDNLPNLIQEALALDDNNGFHEYYEFNARLNAITADILKTKLSGMMRLVYIESRCLELICHALDFLINSPSNLPNIKLSKQDETALENAYSLLLTEFAPAPSITSLSRKLGINRNKLFYGFKIKYGCSVSDFIQTQRLEEGKRLLQQTDMPIIDIAAKVGFGHQSNFSTAIKRHFGLTPTQFRG